MAVEGNTDHRNRSEKSTGDVPDLDSIINDGMDDELLEDNADGDENGDNGQHGDILERIHR